MQQKKPLNILLKLSGEILSGNKGFGHDIDFIKKISNQINEVVKDGHNLSIVVGGGNICRGANVAELGLDRAAADYMGMLATAINAITLQNILESYCNLQVRILSAIHMNTVCEPFIIKKAQSHLKKGRVVIFACGTGTPFFSTDTAAVLRSLEMKCDILIKGTKVDGIYDKDPKKHTNAKRYEKINYDDLLVNNLHVMDMAAIALAQENKLPIKVFSIIDENLLNVINNQGRFTIIESVV